MADLTSIPNIGPATAESLIAVGITSAEELHAVGADEAYARLLQNGTKPHFIPYYVLHMALQGRPWNDCKGEEKKALRKSFDAIKAQKFDAQLSEMEAFLDQIGVVRVKS